MAEYNDELLDHEYDGIKELDNQLPRWWLGLFYVTIIFSVVYLLYYHVLGIGYSQEEQYMAEVDPTYARIDRNPNTILGVLPTYRSPLYSPRPDVTPYSRQNIDPDALAFVVETRETDTVTYAAVDDPQRINQGQEIFVKNCAQCHGNNGEGGIGPNLTDDYWLHGAGMSAVVKSVKYGYPAQGMIPWRGTLSPEEIIEVSSYVLTLRGTDPANQKAPQGELVTEYPE